MSYKLEFHEDAFDELIALDGSVRPVLRKKLNAILANPRIPSARLKGDLENFYKLKLQKAGIRVIYSVDDSERLVKVWSIGKRADKAAYRAAILRILDFRLAKCPK